MRILRLMLLNKTVRIFCLCLVLSCFLGISQVTFAVDNPTSSSIGLGGTISAPAPTQAATITSPANGASFSSLPIKVIGWCPSGLEIQLFKNNVFGGSTMCVNNTYSITADLFSDQNQLMVVDYDALNQAGPNSNIVTVTFNDNASNSGVASRVSLTSNYSKRGANPDQVLTWPIIASGGTTPYAISVDWGDGDSSDLYTELTAGQFNIEHTYDKAGTYNVLVKAEDKVGTVSYLQLVAVSNGEVSQTSASSTNSTVKVQTTTSFPWELVLFATFAAAVSFWLGIRTKHRNVKKRLEQGLPPLGS